MTIITDFPTEILVKIFSFLDIRSLYSCKCTHSTFYRAAEESSIQYQALQEINDVEDNPKIRLSAAEKIAILERSQYGWRRGERDFDMDIPMNHVPSGLYDLSGGMYFSGNQTRTALHYCKLPNQEEELVEWKSIDAGEGRTIVDFGLSTYEHDLLVILTKRHSGNKSMLELKLIKLSTQEPHPEARQPEILVYESAWEKFGAFIEVVGNHLFLIVRHAIDFSAPRDRFLVYDWKNGGTIMSITAPYCAFYGMAALAEDKVLILNAASNRFDLWKVSEKAQDSQPSPEIILKLPELHPQWFLRTLSCRGEPNPARELPFSTNPYESNSPSALVITYLSLGWMTDMKKYVLAIKREAFLDFYPAIALSNPHNGEKSPSSQLENEEHGDQPKTLPWESWGPSCTRFIPLSLFQRTMITMSAGQRLVTINSRDSVTGEQEQFVEIYDFNPLRIKQLEDLTAHDDPSVKIVKEVTRLDAGLSNGFSNEVESGLPYSITEVSDFPEVDVLLMDDQRLLGLKSRDRSNPESPLPPIKVFHLGRRQ